jgi:hypothetical protein
MIVIGSFEIADALLSRKGSIYSDRPALPMGCEIVGWDRAIGLQRFGEKHKVARALVKRVIGSNDEMRKHFPMMEREMRSCLHRLLKHREFEDLEKQLQR